MQALVCRPSLFNASFDAARAPLHMENLYAQLGCEGIQARCCFSANTNQHVPGSVRVGHTWHVGHPSASSCHPCRRCSDMRSTESSLTVAMPQGGHCGPSRLAWVGFP